MATSQKLLENQDANSLQLLAYAKYALRFCMNLSCSQHLLRSYEICCLNLEKMYHFKDGKVPSGIRMREIIDYINSCNTKKPFKELFTVVQRNGELQSFQFSCGKFKNHYLLPIDGTGLFYSSKVSL